jgi:hypothetical protein
MRAATIAALTLAWAVSFYWFVTTALGLLLDDGDDS